MKKFLLSLFTAASLSAAPQAVVFDWGNVLATPDRDVIVRFLCKELKLSKEKFEEANLEKRKAIKAGKTDVEFWIEFAKAKNIDLGPNWPDSYQAAAKDSIGADQDMYSLIDELKENEIAVGMLSNIDDRYLKLIKEFGFYEGFEPCLLSAEIGLEKPDPKIYELLLSKIDAPAAEIVFIDDKEENVAAAKKFGIDAIVFQSAKQIRRELTARELL